MVNIKWNLFTSVIFINFVVFLAQILNNFSNNLYLPIGIKIVGVSAKARKSSLYSPKLQNPKLIPRKAWSQKLVSLKHENSFGNILNGHHVQEKSCFASASNLEIEPLGGKKRKKNAEDLFPFPILGNIFSYV